MFRYVCLNYYTRKKARILLRRKVILMVKENQKILEATTNPSVSRKNGYIYNSFQKTGNEHELGDRRTQLLLSFYNISFIEYYFMCRVTSLYGRWYISIFSCRLFVVNLVFCLFIIIILLTTIYSISLDILRAAFLCHAGIQYILSKLKFQGLLFILFTLENSADFSVFIGKILSTNTSQLEYSIHGFSASFSRTRFKSLLHLEGCDIA